MYEWPLFWRVNGKQRRYFVSTLNIYISFIIRARASKNEPILTKITPTLQFGSTYEREKSFEQVLKSNFGQKGSKYVILIISKKILL